MSRSAFTVRFWGVRDHIAVPGPETAGYGGNTPCLEVRCGETLLIFDCGTGIRLLGQRLLRGGPAEGDLFFSHAQFDRISGLPFFAAAFVPGNAFRLWAGHDGDRTPIQEVVRRLMTDPIFPVPLEVMRAKLEFHDFRVGDVLRPRPGVVLRTGGFNAARPVTGYRIEYGGKALCHVTDVGASSHGDEGALATLMANADLVVFGMESEVLAAEGMAEPDWRWAVACCERARTGTLVLTNHAQSLDDAALDRLAAKVTEARPGTMVAREGMELHI